jgi:hypothetical protein
MASLAALATPILLNTQSAKCFKIKGTPSKTPQQTVYLNNKIKFSVKFCLIDLFSIF